MSACITGAATTSLTASSGSLAGGATTASFVFSIIIGASKSPFSLTLDSPLSSKLGTREPKSPSVAIEESLSFKLAICDTLSDFSEETSSFGFTVTTFGFSIIIGAP